MNQFSIYLKTFLVNESCKFLLPVCEFLNKCAVVSDVGNYPGIGKASWPRDSNYAPVATSGIKS